MPRWRIALYSSILLVVLYGSYLFSSYLELDQAFNQPDEYVPTKIYADLVKISAAMPRRLVEKRLTSLHYSFEGKGTSLSFTLHDGDYPLSLLPTQHPNARYFGKKIELLFEGDQPESNLLSLTVDQQEVADLYLEPELVATLSRSGSDSTDKQIRRVLRFEEIPSSVWRAIISVEDQHFLEHSGLDPRGMARAIWVNLRTRSFSQGGSTLTQQLVKNLMARRTKNLLRKINEVFLSIALEMKYPKERILERYLNEVYLGQIGPLEVHGVAEGAKHFFGKTLDELNTGEIAMMAGLIRGPAYYSPYRYFDRARERQRLILDKMVETGNLVREEAEEAKQAPIRLAPPSTGRNRAPYFSDFVKAEVLEKLKDRLSEQEVTEAGFRIYTTLDSFLNDLAQDSVEKGIEQIEKRFGLVGSGSLEGALASVDPKTGYIRALIGGRNYARSTFNRILNMKRQVGSTFKPIVYLTAFQKGRDAKGIPYGSGYPILDAPWTLRYNHDKLQWSPGNYEAKFRGWFPLREAMINSVNIPAAKIGNTIGLASIIQAAKALGVTTELQEVPSLALGSIELSPVELLRVYATLANQGVRDELTVIRAIAKNDGKVFAEFVYEPKQVFAPEPIALLTEWMKDVFKEGTARIAPQFGFNHEAAGKTGTTNDYRDAWFAGFTPNLATVTWVGLEKGIGAQRLTGAGSALPIWASYMKEALTYYPDEPFSEPQGLVRLKINRATGQLAKPDCPPEWTVEGWYQKAYQPENETCETAYPAKDL